MARNTRIAIEQLRLQLRCRTDGCQSYADSTSSELFWTAKCGHLHCRLCAEKQKKIRCCVCQSSPIKSPKAHQTASTLLAQLREMENLLVGDRSASEDEPSKVFDFPEEVELSPPTNKRRKSESDVVVKGIKEAQELNISLSEDRKSVKQSRKSGSKLESDLITKPLVENLNSLTLTKKTQLADVLCLPSKMAGNEQWLATINRLMGTTSTPSFDPVVVTHVVVMSIESDVQLCFRTLKFLQGIITGKWVVSHQWLIDSLAKGERLSEEEYEIAGSTKRQKRFGPKLSRLNAGQQGPGLFHKYSIHFQGDFGKEYPSRAELKWLAQWGGAEVIDKPNWTRLKKSETTGVIVYKPGSTAAPNKKVQLVTIDQFINSVEEFVVKF